ncbi:MAG: NAD(P)/FAD-dependent oxidoreductase [Treponema sp.]|nr:NAD(P)/FAD-dependent oxidoreductase [Treponema sp.]
MTENTKNIYDLIVIGGGPAGLAAAISAKKNGLDKILLLERDIKLGGVLLQCIHNGFGLHYFKQELTGPEYAERFVKELEELKIEYQTNTMVLELKNTSSQIHLVTAINSKNGLMQLKSKSVIISTGCRERTRGAINIPGTRPAGVFTAGTAQRFVNIDGFIPGKKIVILGSGDIGLIMARRMTLEGSEVKMVLEVQPHSSGLARNITQCLENFNIPLLLNTTVIQIHGNKRVSGVTIARVDINQKPIPGTEQFVECDTLLLSVGLIPENEVSKSAGVSLDSRTKGPFVNQNMQTSVPGIFACGNVVHVHDLVDFVTSESLHAGKKAADYVKTTFLDEKKNLQQPVATLDEKADHQVSAPQSPETTFFPIEAGKNVAYTVPQKLELPDGKPLDEALEIMFRSRSVIKNAVVTVKSGDKLLLEKKSRIIRPGEIQTIKIAPEKLSQISQKLEVYIE